MNPKGVKCVNQKIKSQLFDKYPIIESKTIGAEDLYIGFDGLKDPYTLVGLPITQSPHLELVKEMLGNGNYKDTDYHKRLTHGYLDMRFNQKFKSQIYEKVLLERKAKIEVGTYQPVKVIKLEGQYFIIDGKHTASLCCALNKKVSCIEIMNPLNHSFYHKVFQMMKRKEAEFRKNIELLEKVFISQ